MNLYLITINDKNNSYYDCYDAHVVRSDDVDRVVEMAQDIAADEGLESWDRDHVELLAENVTGDNEIILSSFNAG